jgi:hypothetical protein
MKLRSALALQRASALISQLPMDMLRLVSSYLNYDDLSDFIFSLGDIEQGCEILHFMLHDTLLYERNKLAMPIQTQFALASLDDDALTSLKSRLFKHGNMSFGTQDFVRESDETSTLVSLPAASAGRTFFVVTSSETNACEPGCWCRTERYYAISALLPSSLPSSSSSSSAFSSSTLVPLIVMRGNSEWWGVSEDGVFLAPAAARQQLLDSIGLGNDLAMVPKILKLIVIAVSETSRHEDVEWWDEMVDPCLNSGKTMNRYFTYTKGYTVSPCAVPSKLCALVDNRMMQMKNDSKYADLPPNKTMLPIVNALHGWQEEICTSVIDETYERLRCNGYFSYSDQSTRAFRNEQKDKCKQRKSFGEREVRVF